MDLGEHMNVTATPLGSRRERVEATGLTPIPGRHVAVPRVGESRAAMECKVTEVSQLADARVKVEGWFVLGEVVAVYIDKSLIEDGARTRHLRVPYCAPAVVEITWGLGRGYVRDRRRWRQAELGGSSTAP